MSLEDDCNSILGAKNFDFVIKDKQLEIIESILKGNDTFAVLPTGYGKTICYVLPPLHLDKRNPSRSHTALIISPLKSLIKDQVGTLRDHDISAFGIYEGMEENDLEGIKAGRASVLIASPESALTKHWKVVLTNVYKDRLCMVTYDEAHCVSEWGLDFRADYRKVGVLQSIYECPVLALTATATTEILTDIKTTLSLSDVKVISILPDRLNTFICVTASSEKYEEELEWIRAGIEEKGRSMKKVVIYVNSIAMCERLYIWFCSSLKEKAYDGLRTIEHRLVEMYHAHTDADSKERIMSDFCQTDGYIKVLVATVAVGMGIDICDIAMVVIWGLPPSLLQLWQEAGRCGRDGRESIVITYAFPRSISLPCNNCRKQGKSVCTCQNRSYLKQLVHTSECQRTYILQSFSVNEENEKELHDLKNKKGCSGTCTDICRCSLCTCCIVCLQSCKCSMHSDSMKQQIMFYLK